jgi:hypothetical protein
MNNQTSSALAEWKNRQPTKGNPNLDSDINIATAQIIAALSGDALPADAFQILIAKNRALAHAPDDEIHDSLTRQAAILERLFLHFAAKAATEHHADRAAALVKASLNCSRTLNTVLATVHNLAESKRKGDAIEAV